MFWVRIYVRLNLMMVGAVVGIFIGLWDGNGVVFVYWLEFGNLDLDNWD